MLSSGVSTTPNRRNYNGPTSSYALFHQVQNGLGWNHQQQLLLNHPWYTSRNAPFYNLHRKSDNILNILAFQHVPQQHGYYNYDCTTCCNCCQSCRQLSPQFLYPHPIQIIKQQPKLATSGLPLTTVNTAPTSTTINTTSHTTATSITSNTTTYTAPSVSTTSARPTTNLLTSYIYNIKYYNIYRAFSFNH
ncbi:hypothetical protein QE152_g8213 [Popillia japonica]|uniref:Uncharacterized protein n=1 Tax=Popillia japonica TaxID=7064 RepID=A0AAW1M4Z6_POPJA